MVDLTKRHFFEGSMGTMLQAKGLAGGEHPEAWNVRNPGAVADVHRAYKAAGCNIHKTNTFGANRIKLAETGLDVEEIIGRGVALAKEAAAGGCVALSVGPSGKLLEPFGDLGFEEAVDCFAQAVSAGDRAGADIVLIETMGDTYEIKAAMLAAKESCGLPVFVTFTIDENGRLLTGGDVATAVCMIEALGAAAVGFNCGLGPLQMKMYLGELAEAASIPLIVNPNAGMPALVDGRTVFGVGPAEFSAHMSEIAGLAGILGGCCGTTPGHMRAMADACGDIPAPEPLRKTRSSISSYSKSARLGEAPLIIGERMNPTGKPRMKAALRSGDMGYVYGEGLRQLEAGAHVLDINVGLPGIDEAAVLSEAVRGLQAITDAPLQIDTSDPRAAEKALRLYNGRPLLNSVSGKEESLSAVLPVAKKYGAAVVALLLDDAGIPETAEGRLEIADRIIARAEEAGISRRDIVFDPLALTIGAGQQNAGVTLAAVKALRERGLKTVLGVSNVSFGLPSREAINAAFFTIALWSGLDLAIINPMSAPMMDAYFSYMALSCRDAGSEMYIGRFAAKSAPPPPAASDNADVSLREAVAKGLKENAEKSAAKMLADTPPLEIIDGHLIPALNEAGEKFERREFFLPQLLSAAEAAKAAFGAIKSHMASRGEGGHAKKGRIVLATVYGDVHDIGKNIVRVLLENFNYEVIDLGKNVRPADIADAALASGAGLVGLSALMTTTVPYMEETIALIKAARPDCRVMTGGAVLTEDFARRIGADFYAKDAMSGVRYAETLPLSNPPHEPVL